jgi:hypothetical protein
MYSVHARYGYRRAVLLASPPQCDVLFRIQIFKPRRGIRRSFESEDGWKPISTQGQRALRNRAGPVDYTYRTSHAATEQ